MNIESPKITKQNEVKQQTQQKTQSDSDVKFSDELNELKSRENTETVKNAESDIDNEKKEYSMSNDKAIDDNTEDCAENSQPKINNEILHTKEAGKDNFVNNAIDDNTEDCAENSQPKINNKILHTEEAGKDNFVNNAIDDLTSILSKLNNPEEKELKNTEETDIIQYTEGNGNFLSLITEKSEYLSQKEDIKVTELKRFNDFDDKNKEEGENLINNDFSIDSKDKLPQMTPNMNFSGDGQPFSSFMNNNEHRQNEEKLSASAKDLAEEAAILSTMAENIAMANKTAIEEPGIKIVTKNDGVKKVDTKTNIVQETIVKYDAVIMNEADVEVFAELVQNGEADLKHLAPEAAKKSVHVSKTLADMLTKAMEDNKPVRIEFDNGISVIIKISRDGKLSADFLPSTQIAEAYLKEKLPLLKQRFDEQNIDYDELNQRERREQNREQNRKKGQENE